VVIGGGINVRPGVVVAPTETSLAEVELTDSVPPADEAEPVDTADAETSE
jgi:hypothetical protein